MTQKVSPLFLKFINREVGVTELLGLYSKSLDPYTSETANKAISNPPSLDEFRTELYDAVGDIITVGIGEEFKSFVNNYMESSLKEDVETSDGTHGENITRMAYVKDASAPWMQGLLCYNLVLYIKAFGLDELKKCRVCGKLFAHKGQYAVYCSDLCKSQKGTLKNVDKNRAPGQG
jgi:hypothetical protein